MDMETAHGSAETEHRPSSQTLHWSAASMVGLVVLAIATHDGTYLFPAAMCFALMLQCSQRVVVDRRFVRRIGLRPTQIDLTTAEIVHTGSAWWRQLFFCGPMLQLRDAEGHRLYLEAWLWDAATRDALVAAVPRRATVD